jgi:hypothetical protein
MRLISLTVSVALVAACSSSSTNHEIVASDYDQACTKDSDCIAVAVGADGCCGLPCPNAAINSSSNAQYEEDVATRRETCDPALPCIGVPCSKYAAICTKGLCSIGAAQAPDAG